MKILWLGPVVNKETEKEIKAISPAANRWQYNFIRALKHNDVNVINISHITESSWPRGRFFVDSSTSKLKDIKQITVNYLNFYFLREISISFTTISKIFKYRKNEYDYIFTYNESLRNKIVALFFKLIFKKPWISILADGRTSGKSDLVLFLSEDYYRRYDKKKYLLEGGIESFIKSDETDMTYSENYLLYAGSMTEVTGIVDFIKKYSLLDIKNELHLYGKPTKEVVELSKTNPKIILKGFVSDEELDQACNKAFAFINPRGDNEESNNTFPSKLLLYLRYRKPIISYKSSGIPSKFNDVLIYYNNEDELEKILNNLNTIEREKYSNKIEKFQRVNSWNFLVRIFTNKLDDIIK